MSDNQEQQIEEETQTRIHVFPHTSIDEENVAVVYCDRVCQTAVSTFPELEPNVFYSLLEFIPYKDITQDAVRIVDLPRKARLQFKIPEKDDDETASLTSQNRLSDLDTSQVQKGALKHKFSDEDSVIISVIHPVRQAKRETKENIIQTNLTVLPHILEEDQIANVYTELPVQTAITLVPKESYTVVVSALEANPREKESSGSQTSYTFLPVVSPTQAPTSASFTRGTHGLGAIDRTAHKLAASGSVENNIKEILQFTTNTISSEIAKIAKIYSNSDMRCQCPQTPCKKRDAVTNTSKSEVPTCLSMQKSAAGRTGNITTVNNEGENTKIKIHSSDNQKAEVRKTAPTKGQTAKGTPTPDANRKKCCSAYRKNPDVVGIPDRSCSINTGHATATSNATVSNINTSGASPTPKSTQEAFGDHKLKKKVQNISCECHPSATGAAPAISPIHTPVSSDSQISKQNASATPRCGVPGTSKNAGVDNSQVPNIKIYFKCDVGVPDSDSELNDLKSSRSCPDNRLQNAIIRIKVYSDPGVFKPLNMPKNPYITLSRDTSKCKCVSRGTNTKVHMAPHLKSKSNGVFNKSRKLKTEQYDSHVSEPQKERNYNFLFKFDSGKDSERNKNDISQNGSCLNKQKHCAQRNYACSNLQHVPSDFCSDIKICREKNICNSKISKLKNRRYKNTCINIPTLSHTVSIWCHQSSSASFENVSYQPHETNNAQEISDNATSVKFIGLFETAKPKESVIGFDSVPPKLLENPKKNLHANSCTIPNINFHINELKEKKTDLCVCSNGLTPLPNSNSGNLQDYLNVSHIIVHITTQQIKEPCRNFVLRVKMAPKEKTPKCVSSSKLKPTQIESQVSVMIIEQDTDYVEHYIEELKDIEDGDGLDEESDTESLNSVEGSCTSITEMPWHKIALPEPGTYVIKSTKDGKGGESSGFRECECDAENAKDDTVIDEASPAPPPQEDPAPAEEAEAGAEEAEPGAEEAEAGAEEGGDENGDGGAKEKSKKEENNCDENEHLPYVYNHSNEYRYMEPYMDKLYRKYKDSEICPPGIEMPWHDILLPITCKLKNTRKKKKNEEDDFTGMFITIEEDLFENQENAANCKPSVPFAVCGAAASQATVSCVSTVSELSKPKRCPKEFTLHIGLGKSDVQIGFQSGEGEIKPIPLGSELHSTDSQPFAISTKKKAGDKISYVVNLKSSGKVNVPQDDSAIMAVVDAICDGNTCYISPKKPPPTVPCPADSSNRKNLKATVSFKRMGEKDKTVTNVMRMVPGGKMNVKVPDTPYNVVMKVSEGDIQKQQNANEKACCPPKCARKDSKKSDSFNSFKQDAVMAALESYEAEMKPLKTALYDLQEKIRSLNISEMNSSLCPGPPRQEQTCYSNQMPSYNQPSSYSPQTCMFSEQDAFAASPPTPPIGICPFYSQQNYMSPPALMPPPSQYSCIPQCGPSFGANSTMMSTNRSPSPQPCPIHFSQQSYMPSEPTYSPPMNGNYHTRERSYNSSPCNPPTCSDNSDLDDGNSDAEDKFKCPFMEVVHELSSKNLEKPKTRSAEPPKHCKSKKKTPPKKSPSSRKGCPGPTACKSGHDDALRSGTGVKTEPAQFK